MDTPETRCIHFGECGGCATQDIPYDEQCARKGAFLEELLLPFRSGSVSVTSSPIIWHYRNKIDLNFGRMFYDEPPPPGFVRETVIGFKRKGRWFHPLDIQECRIGPKGIEELLDNVRAWYRAADLRAYDSRTHDGTLKILLLREGKRTGQRMAVLITGPEFDQQDAFAEVIQRAWPADSVHHAVSESRAGAAFAETSTVLAGSSTIEEALHIPDRDGIERSLRFRISPFSFFQTNTLATERLYGLIRAMVAQKAPKTLYDLYGGAGGIALTCADCVGQVISVENVTAASEDGRFNAAQNGIDNVMFITDKMKNYLRAELIAGASWNADVMAVVDPPRAGMHPKAVRRLIELGPPHIVYVSCKPTVFIRDELPHFLDHYRLEAAQAVDLFPHTDHVELVMLLERR